MVTGTFRKISAFSSAQLTLPVWTATFAVMLAYAAAFSCNIPEFDWWNSIPLYAGLQPITPGWLWEQDAEARVPLPRAIEAALCSISGNDFRAPVIASVLLIATAALLLILAARRFRGRTSAVDAVFPLLLLGLGNYESVLLGYYMAYSISFLLLCGFLAAVASRNEPGLAEGLVAGSCAALLPLSGPTGEVTAIPLAVWVTAFGLSRKQYRIAGMGIIACIFSASYMVGFKFPDNVPPAPGMVAVIRTSLQFISMSFGPIGAQVWPVTTLVILILLTTTSIVIRNSWRSNPAERWRTAGIISFLVSMAVLALCIGWGRGGWADDAGIRRRYSMIAVPILCSSFLAWESLRGSAMARASRAILVALAAAAYLLNIKPALEFGRMRSGHFHSLRADITSGFSVRELAARWWPDYYYGEWGTAKGFEMMARSRIGPYRGFQDIPDTTLLGNVKGWTTALAFSPRTNVLAAGTGAGKLVIFGPDGRAGTLVDAHNGDISSLAFSPDGRTLLSAGWDGRVKFWAVTGKRVRATAGEQSTERVMTLFSPNGRQLAMGRDDGLARLLDSTSGIKLAVLRGHDGEIRAMDFSPDGTHLATAGWDRLVRIWSTASGQNTAVLRGHTDVVCAAAYSPDSRILATASWDGTVRLWDPEGKSRTLIMNGNWSRCSVAAFSPDSTLLALGGDSGEITIWSLKISGIIRTFKAHTTSITSLAFSRDGHTLASGSREGPARLWVIPGPVDMGSGKFRTGNSSDQYATGTDRQ